MRYTLFIIGAGLVVSQCITIQRLTESYNLPGIITTFKTTGKESSHNLEIFQGYKIEKSKSLVYKSENGTETANVLLYFFENSEKALGGYLETRRESVSGKKIQNTNSQEVRWGHYSPEKKIAALWHGEVAVIVIFEKEKTADEVVAFSNKLVKRWKKSVPRYQEFNLLLREETSIKEVRYAVDDKHLPEVYLQGFFYAPWKAGVKTGHIVFRKFSDSIGAENFLYALSGNEGYYLTVVDYPARKVSHQVSVTSTGLFYKSGETVIGIRGNFTFAEAKEELKKIWDVKD